MLNSKQFIGRWANFDQQMRSEQELHEDGRLEVRLFDSEEGCQIAEVKGTWRLVGESVEWHYELSRMVVDETFGPRPDADTEFPLPRKKETNAVIRCEANCLEFREFNRRTTVWYRVADTDETSTNFDFEEVPPFLARIAAMIEKGLGAEEIAALVAKLRKLKVERSAYSVFVITFGGVVSPLQLRAFKDDVDAVDVYFYGPKGLIDRIDAEMKKLCDASGA